MSRPPITVGVDTHKSSHVAVALSATGARLGTITIPTDPDGYQALIAWSTNFGSIAAFGIEGTGSYGAGLSRYLLAKGHHVIEVTRPNRQLRHSHGKTDDLDAEGAARSVLNGQAAAKPKTHNGFAKMIRHLKVTRDTAVKSRSQAMITLKSLIINAPDALRESLDRIHGKIALVRHIAALRPGELTSTLASVKTALRALARRWLMLHEEIQKHDVALDHLVAKKAQCLIASHGIATMTAAEMLILIGDEPQRIKSEAALAKLCGVCPIPASSGQTKRYRLNRGGNRQANSALHRIVIVRMRGHEPTLAYVRKRTSEGKTKREIIRCLKRYVVREIFQLLCLCRPETLKHCD